MRIRPMYSRDGITIYHGDCRDVLPQIETGSVDLVLTDPPYGIGRDGMRESTSSHGGRKAYEFKGWDSEPPSAETFEQMFRVSKHQVIWGANYFTQNLPPSMGWLFWDKGQRIAGSDGELAFTSFPRALRVWAMNRVAIQTDGAVHPTQKPVALMQWILDKCSKPGDLILDPFMGSGSTAVACQKMNRRYIGIEINEDYCITAYKRLQQTAMNLEGVA